MKKRTVGIIILIAMILFILIMLNGAFYFNVRLGAGATYNMILEQGNYLRHHGISNSQEAIKTYCIGEGYKFAALMLLGTFIPFFLILLFIIANIFHLIILSRKGFWGTFLFFIIFWLMLFTIAHQKYSLLISHYDNASGYSMSLIVGAILFVPTLIIIGIIAGIMLFIANRLKNT